LDRGETMIEGAIREVREESGLEVKKINPLTYVDSELMYKGTPREYIYVAHFHLGRIAAGGTVQMSDEHQDYEWINKHQVARHNVTPLTIRATDAFRSVF